MILVLVGIAAIIVSIGFRQLQEVQERALRWKFYALRDRLRRAAITDRRLLETKAYWSLEKLLTTFCSVQEHFSLWMLLAVGPVTNDQELEHDIDCELGRPEVAAALLPIARDAVILVRSALSCNGPVTYQVDWPRGPKLRLCAAHAQWWNMMHPAGPVAEQRRLETEGTMSDEEKELADLRKLVYSLSLHGCPTNVGGFECFYCGVGSMSYGEIVHTDSCTWTRVLELAKPRRKKDER